MPADSVFAPGDRVTLVGRSGVTGVIVNKQPRTGADGGTIYLVDFGTSRVEWRRADQLRPLDAYGLASVSRRRFLSDLAVLKLSHPFTDVLYSMGASRTRFLVYQYQPVIKFVQSMPHGMMIADEVGLGKTIEAGFILKELLARGSITRALIVCPANLREKWRAEMQLRFGLEFRVIKAEDIRSIRTDVERGGWPSFFGIMSLEGLRRDDLQQVLLDTGIQFDLVIVDEAHHMRNPQTLSFQLGETLSDQADHILLLSATPVQTGAMDLLSLLRLIEPAQFRGTSTNDLDDLLEPNRYINGALSILARPNPNRAEAVSLLENVYTTGLGTAFQQNPIFETAIKTLKNNQPPSPVVLAQIRRDLQHAHTLAPYYTRTRKREVEEVARRRPHVYRISLTAAEQEFYRAWVDFVTELAMTRTGAPPAWVTSMRERQAASALPAAREALEGLLGGLAPNDVESSDPEPLTDDGDSYFGRPNLDQYGQAVRKAGSALGDQDTKASRLLEVIGQLLEAKPGRKVLLFTFFKGTLRYLRKRLQAAGIGCHSISGDDRPEQRGSIIEHFMRDNNSSVLLSTEVGAEGLDFQFCDAIINYDLPWNPMRVEQRIGRIDRFGQREQFVDVVSFFVEGTIDTRILDRLYSRIRVFQESIGELEPILGPIVQKLQTEVFSERLTEAEQQQLLHDALQRVENLRIQYEEFETARAELMGQGDVIRQEIEATRDSGRYVSPAEIEALVAEWLRATPQSFDEVRPADESGWSGVYELRLSHPTVVRIQDQMVKESRRDSVVGNFLRRFLQVPRGHRAPVPVWCTFDSEVAQRHDGLHYIDPSHPIVRTVLADPEHRAFSPPHQRIGRLALQSKTGWPSQFLLFIYRLSVRGLEETVSMVPVVVDVDNNGVVVGLGDEVLGLLATAEDSSFDVKEGIDQEHLDELEHLAFESADSRRMEAEVWARDTQLARAAARRATLNRGFRARIARKRETLAKVTESRIIRLYEGEIRNLEAALETRLEELESAPEPSASLELVAIAYVNTGAAAAL